MARKEIEPIISLGNEDKLNSSKELATLCFIYGQN